MPDGRPSTINLASIEDKKRRFDDHIEKITRMMTEIDKTIQRLELRCAQGNLQALKNILLDEEEGPSIKLQAGTLILKHIRENNSATLNSNWHDPENGRIHYIKIVYRFVEELRPECIGIIAQMIGAERERRREGIAHILGFRRRKMRNVTPATQEERLAIEKFF